MTRLCLSDEISKDYIRKRGMIHLEKYYRWFKQRACLNTFGFIISNAHNAVIKVPAKIYNSVQGNVRAQLNAICKL